jgi:hypothetical protein
MPDTPLRFEFTEYLRRIDALTDAGIDPTRPFQELRDRYDRYRQMPRAGAQRLADALILPRKGDDLNWLSAHAYAESAAETFPPVQATVDNTVSQAIEARLRELYQPHAERNHATAQARFDAIAAELSAAAATGVDLETTDATTVAAMTDEQRAAWASAPTVASQLDSALAVLVITAALAGVTADMESGSLITLAVSPVDMGRRELWAAWEDTGRCGRWSALAKLGAKIRAADLPDVVAYRRPKELEHRLVPTSETGIYDSVIVDPEAPGYQPPEQLEQAMIPGRRLTSR